MSSKSGEERHWGKPMQNREQSGWSWEREAAPSFHPEAYGAGGPAGAFDAVVAGVPEQPCCLVLSWGCCECESGG